MSVDASANGLSITGQLSAGAGCTTLSGSGVTCAAPPAPLGYIVLWGDNGDDTLRTGSGVPATTEVMADGGPGDDSYVLDAAARGVAAAIADSGGDARDSISLGCRGARLLAASVGPRDRRGRYAVPNGAISFAGLDGALPCALPRG